MSGPPTIVFSSQAPNGLSGPHSASQGCPCCEPSRSACSASWASPWLRWPPRTVLPFVHTKWWFVRLMDFPRVLYLVGLIAAVLALLPFLRHFTRTTLVLLCAVVAAFVINAVILWPYWPSGGTAVASCPAERTLSVMIANVELGNRESAPLLKAVADRKPDLFLAMETDEWWDKTLQPIAADMPHTVQKITGSYYGIHFFSRLPLVDPTIHVFADRDTPSVVTGVTLRTSETVTFVGMHPKPPIPGQSSLGRDAELYAAGEMLRDKAPPAILAGDLNAVPWEQAVERMRRIAGLVDPRRGYGYVASWNAKRWWAKWPLDNIFDRGGFGVVSLERLDAFGSDHYPYIVRLCRETSSAFKMPATIGDDDREAIDAADKEIGVVDDRK